MGKGGCDVPVLPGHCPHLGGPCCSGQCCLAALSPGFPDVPWAMAAQGGVLQGVPAPPCMGVASSRGASCGLSLAATAETRPTVKPRLLGSPRRLPGTCLSLAAMLSRQVTLGRGALDHAAVSTRGERLQRRGGGGTAVSCRALGSKMQCSAGAGGHREGPGPSPRGPRDL